MLTEIASGVASLKAATDIVTALNGMMKAADVADAKLTLQRHLLDAYQSLSLAQQAQATSNDRIRDLEQEIVRMKDWSTERQQYELREVSPGAFAYVDKAAMEGPKSRQWFCANCFDGGKKSILQYQGSGKTSYFSVHSCPSCSATVVARRAMTISSNIMD